MITAAQQLAKSHARMSPELVAAHALALAGIGTLLHLKGLPKTWVDGMVRIRPRGELHMSTLRDPAKLKVRQELDASDKGTALRIARAVSGLGHRQRDDQPDTALVNAPLPFTIADKTILKQEIKRPQRPLIDRQYETDCREAVAPLLEELLDQFEAVGWNRKKAAYEMMYLAAKRMNVSK